MTSARQAERKYALGVTFCEIACRAADYAANEGVYNAILEHAQAMIRHMSRSEGEWSGEIRNTIARACREIPAEEVLILLLRLDGMFLHTREQLRKAWDEKSEINRKLQVTYEEKAERGIQINELKEQVKAAKQQTKEIKQHAKEYRLEKKESERALKKSLRKKEAVMRETKEELAETKAELKELKQRFLVRLSLKLGTLFRRKP